MVWNYEPADIAINRFEDFDGAIDHQARQYVDQRHEQGDGFDAVKQIHFNFFCGFDGFLKLLISW